MSRKQYVILLHGLSLNSYSMYFIAKKLAKAGFEVINIDYPSRKYTIEYLADYLHKKLANIAPGQLNFVGHSMGGIVIRYYLSIYQNTKLGNVVLIAPPNKGSELTEYFENNNFYKWYLGPAWPQLRADHTSFVNNMVMPYYNCGVIAGNKVIELYYSRQLPNPNDGIISVESTKLSGSSQHIILPCNHINILWNKEAINATCNFIMNGRF